MAYKFIDLTIGLGAGALIAGGVIWWMPENINMFWGMVLGTLGGMGLQFILTMLLFPLFGAFEVMIPLHIIGMLVGMVSGMIATRPDIPGHCIIATGGLIGLMVAGAIYFSNKKHIGTN